MTLDFKQGILFVEPDKFQIEKKTTAFRIKYLSENALSMKFKSFYGAIITGIVVFILAILLAEVLKHISGFPSWLSQVFMKVILVILSVIVARLLSLPLSKFGFQQSSNTRNRKKYIVLALLLGALSSSIILIFKIPKLPVLEGLSFFQILLVVWLWSSITEEIFARGFVQALASESTSTFKVTPFNVSSGGLASAIVFSLIHFSIWVGGGSIYTTVIIMIFTFLLGILCSKTRDEINLQSAIYVHIAFNVGGAIGGIIINIIYFISTGERIA